MGDIQGDPWMWSAKMEQRNCKICMCIWEVYPYKFHGSTIPFTYTPSRWNLIGECCINEVDVFFERFMKTLKIYVQQKEHLEGCMAEGYVLNGVFFFLYEFHCKDFKGGPCFWDEEWALDIIDGEKPQYYGVQIEISN